jgi:hypothetical protein
MATELPKVKYKGVEYIVDFKLGEIRPVKPPLRSIPFTSIKDEAFKAQLRGVRFNTWANEYIRGLDD